MEEATRQKEAAEATKATNVPLRAALDDRMEGLETAVRQTTMAMRDVEHMAKEPSVDVVKLNKAKSKLATLAPELTAAREELSAHEALQVLGRYAAVTRLVRGWSATVTRPLHGVVKAA